MYQINDYVVYGATGVCQVVDISRENFGGKVVREYYVLNPVYGNSMSIFIPTDSRSAVMRHILSKADIMELIHSMPAIDGGWIEDDHLRKATFNETLQSGDLNKLAQLIKMIYHRKEFLESQGKHLTSADTEAMKISEKLLYNELALVLDIAPDEVVPFIMEKIPDSKFGFTNN